MTNIRTSNGETEIPEELFNRTAEAITNNKHGFGWISQVARLVGLAPRIILGVEDKMLQREAAIKKREGLATSASLVSQLDSESTLQATENKPGTGEPNEGHDGFVWDREK